MSFITRAVSRVAPAAQSSSVLLSRSVLNSVVAASSRNFTKLTQSTNVTSARCPVSCFCCSRGFHSEADQRIVDFLHGEIIEEKKNLKGKVPAFLDDFSVKVDKSHVNLYRKFNDEEININLYVNHSVSPVHDGSVSTPDADEGIEFTSKPDFEVDVSAGGKTLSLSCAFTDAEMQEGEGLFGISEILMREGEDSDSQYAATGEVIDETLYDMMLEYLAERGITEEFADRLSELCTNYEHSLYVGLLGDVRDFVARK